MNLKTVMSPWLLGAVMGLGGCASSQPAGEPRAPQAACLQFEAEDLRPGTITIATDLPLDPGHIRLPETETERMLFRHLYETLVGVDCEGQVIDALAVSWAPRAGGRIWRFVLRDGAAFQDGTPVTAAAVRDAWKAWLERRPDRQGQPPWTWVAPDSVFPAGGQALEIRLHRPTSDGPRLFAAPELSVLRMTEAAWPLGTGPYHLAGPATGDTLLCEPSPRHPRPGTNRLRWIVQPGLDPRDLLSSEADLVLIRDREDLEYAKSIPDHRVLPLPWSRLYLLASRKMACDPAEVRALGALRNELSTQVMEAEAIATAFFSFEEGARTTCAEVDRPVPVLPQPGENEVLRYPEGDGDAGRIAARLVALTTSGDGDADPKSATCLPSTASPVAEAGSPATWPAAVEEGLDHGYVLSVRQNFPNPCLDLSGLVARVPWLELGAGGSGTAIPLVLARDVLVSRKGLVRIGIDWDGTPLLQQAGWDARPAVP